MISSGENFGKIIIIGDSTVGKTTLSMCQLKRNTQDVKSTSVAAAFFRYTTEIDNIKINLEVWDTAGEEKYQETARTYYRNVDCALIVFDVTNKDSFDHLKQWYEAINTERNGIASIILVANKIDDVNNNVIDRSQGLSKSKEYNCDFVETSGLIGINVDKLFDLAAKVILKKKYEVDCTDSISKSHRRSGYKFSKTLRSKTIILNEPPNEDDSKIESKSPFFYYFKYYNLEKAKDQSVNSL